MYIQEPKKYGSTKESRAVLRALGKRRADNKFSKTQNSEMTKEILSVRLPEEKYAKKIKKCKANGAHNWEQDKRYKGPKAMYKCNDCGQETTDRDKYDKMLRGE